MFLSPLGLQFSVENCMRLLCICASYAAVWTRRPYSCIMHDRCPSLSLKGKHCRPLESSSKSLQKRFDKVHNTTCYLTCFQSFRPVSVSKSGWSGHSSLRTPVMHGFNRRELAKRVVAVPPCCCQCRARTESLQTGATC